MTRTMSCFLRRSSSGRISPRKRLPGNAIVSIWIGPVDSTGGVSKWSGASGSSIEPTIVAEHGQSEPPLASDALTNHVRDGWDAQAATFDDEPDHGLTDPAVRAAWSSLLLPLLPTPPASVADIGCGTGSLSVLLAEAGHDVRGVDSSGAMVAAAERKADAAGVSARFVRGDAQAPPFEPQSFDVVLVRHVLWALPDPHAAINEWIALLKPPGILILVEGRWATGAGLTAVEAERLVRRLRSDISVDRLHDRALWGRAIDDERYLLVSRG